MECEKREMVRERERERERERRRGGGRKKRCALPLARSLPLPLTCTSDDLSPKSPVLSPPSNRNNVHILDIMCTQREGERERERE